MSADATVKWKKKPEDHDYPAAAAYLSLIADAETVDRLVEALRAAPVTRQKAKDIIRAARLAVLGSDDVHVRADLAKVAAGEKLSPILLVRGDYARGVPLQIADGYHRVCASYHLDTDTDIPVKLVDGQPPQ